jgi:hypothetical protein
MIPREYIKVFRRANGSTAANPRWIEATVIAYSELGSGRWTVTLTADGAPVEKWHCDGVHIYTSIGRGLEMWVASMQPKVRRVA